MTSSRLQNPVQEIVLVEDNPQDAELTMRALRSHNAATRLKWAQNGAEALEMLLAPNAEAVSCIVLLDLKMPMVDGHEVLRRLKGNPRTRSIPVVVLTSSGEEGDVARAYEEGANSYVVKPVGFERFREMIADLCGYWLEVNQPAPHAPQAPDAAFATPSANGPQSTA